MLAADCHDAFTSKHLVKVLDKCFKSVELDDHVVKESRERGGQTVEVDKTVKGLVDKCLEKVGAAFKGLENTRSKTKEYRLSVLCECRPGECRSAAELLLWLIEVGAGRDGCGGGFSVFLLLWRGVTRGGVVCRTTS